MARERGNTQTHTYEFGDVDGGGRGGLTAVVGFGGVAAALVDARDGQTAVEVGDERRVGVVRGLMDLLAQQQTLFVIALGLVEHVRLHLQVAQPHVHARELFFDAQIVGKARVDDARDLEHLPRDFEVVRRVARLFFGVAFFATGHRVAKHTRCCLCTHRKMIVNT